VGERLPAHCTSLGKVLLAFQSPATVDRVLEAGLRRYTPTTITDPKLLREELEMIRSSMIGYNHAEYRLDSIAVAAPVWDHEGQLAATVSASGPAYRLEGPRLAEATETVRVAARQLSASLGAKVAGGDTS
jgi:IclR family transcriptional regulator, KDG regulon repressor